MEIKQYHYYEAEVKVKDKSTLKQDANLIDGSIIKVEALWIIDQGVYEGQYALKEKNGLWIPQEDLIIIREITYTEFDSKIAPLESVPPQPLQESKP